MERLYIRMLDGLPFEHPILESNLLECFPDLDLKKLPPWLAVFERHDPSLIKVGGYEHLVEQYVVENGKVRDNWHTRPMSKDERADKLAALKAEDQPDRVLDEEKGEWVIDLTAPGKEPDAL
jgi:hypothetical protein